jgi:3-oxoadipate enol-lactonase
MNSSITLRKIRIPHSAFDLTVYDQGDPVHPVVVMSHSILSSSAMWMNQANLLSSKGFRVIRVDTRGHGASDAPPAPYSIDDLARDMITTLDALEIEQAHYIGLSLGGMIGFGLGIGFGHRLLSLCLCDARADMPTALGDMWNERIDIALAASSCKPLALPTTERWFGKPFVDANPAISNQFQAMVTSTSVSGFIGCAKAIQGLDYLPRVAQIQVPTTLIAGENDGAFPDVMRAIQTQIKGCSFELIPNAGHLPPADQPAAFNAAMLRHFSSYVA